MAVTLQELIDTIDTDPGAVRESLELIKKTLNDVPAAPFADVDGAAELGLFVAVASFGDDRVMITV